MPEEESGPRDSDAASQTSQGESPTEPLASESTAAPDGVPAAPADKAESNGVGSPPADEPAAVASAAQEAAKNEAASLVDGVPLDEQPTVGPLKWKEARVYVPGAELVIAIDLAVALGLPLLITGLPGTGKTAAAYWAAWKLGLTHDRIIHHPIRSSTTSDDLKYRFDSVAFFRESQLAVHRSKPSPKRAGFILPGPFFQAYEMSHDGPVVLLLDEIDKAPRDLPNDILYELEEGRFQMPELVLDAKESRNTEESATTPEDQKAGEKQRGDHLLLCIITSNGERDLPSAFLRRCLHHHIELDPKQVKDILVQRNGEFGLSEELLTFAAARYAQLKEQNLDHVPDLAEYLVWLRALKTRGLLNQQMLKEAPLSEIECASALIKTPEAHQRRVRDLL